MKRWKKVAMTATAAALSCSMVLGMSACGEDVMQTIEVSDVNAYYEESQEIYDSELGEFYEAYMAAKAITGSSDEELAERYALMAIAEAKFLESAVMVPTTSNGGNYAISKLVPHTYSYVLWGNDSDRFHQALVTNQFVTADDRATINEMYNTALSEGVDGDTYSARVREFLTEQGYTIKDSYTMGYTGDPTTFDVLATSNAVDSEVLVNTYDGLMEYDETGNLQYALADSYTISDSDNGENTVYTFHIRDDAYWYTAAGERYAQVTADDFVAGFQHMLDAQGGLEYLVDGLIVGAGEYIDGTLTDFSQVGVKQVNESGEPDENGEYVQYTLTGETSYFLTMLSYGVFAPMNRAFYTAQGGAFGADFDATYGGRTDAYGTSYQTILYCGPYIISQYTAESTIAFSSYEGYYNYDHINLKSITWLSNDGTNATKAYEDLKDGTIDGAGLNSSSLVLAESETTTDLNGKTGTYFDLFGYVSTTDATTFMAFYNLNRKAYANYNDGTTAVTVKSTEDAERTQTALLNVHFRRALSFAFDRITFNAQSVGDELAANSLRNSYTPGTFVQLPTSVTVEINGTATTFETGTYYGAIVQAQLDADGVPITAFKEVNGEWTSDGFDGWYNVENAVDELEIAIEELAAEGVEISADNPIEIDYVYVSTNTTYSNRANAYKQSLESALNGMVQVNLIGVSDLAGWYYSGYYPSVGYDMNFDMNDVSGWAPDYGDASSYLDTLLPEGTGYMTKVMGLW